MSITFGFVLRIDSPARPPVAIAAAIPEWPQVSSPVIDVRPDPMTVSRVATNMAATTAFSMPGRAHPGLPEAYGQRGEPLATRASGGLIDIYA